MKKFKLNAVVALVLSFGMVCSSSAFASKVGGKSLKETFEKPVEICSKNDTIRSVDTSKGKSQKKYKKEPKLKRCNATLNSIFTDAEITSKAQKSEISSVKKVKSDDKSKINKMTIESLKSSLDAQLKDIIECSKKWENLNSNFIMIDFKELPLTSSEFISESINFYGGFYTLLCRLKVKAESNGLKHESEVFSSLQLTCNKIYDQYLGEKINEKF